MPCCLQPVEINVRVEEVTSFQKAEHFLRLCIASGLYPIYIATTSFKLPERVGDGWSGGVSRH